VVAVSLAMILAMCQFRVLSGDVALFFLVLVCLLGWVGVGVCFSMESLILAQDERWRRA
jgi:hypothetical protein